MTKNLTNMLYGLLLVTSVARALELGRVRNIVAPSVAKADFHTFGQELQACVDAGCEWLHWSVQDGHFCPKISFGAPLIAAERAHQSMRLPRRASRRPTAGDHFPETVFDVKLTIDQPERHVASFAKAGADILSVHPEATKQLGAVLQMIKDHGLHAGVVLNPATPVAAVEEMIDIVDVAVVMLVNPGYGGPKYLEGAVKKIKALRALKPELFITVDGGVNAKNAPALLDAGANVFVAGGAIFKTQDKAGVIRELLGPTSYENNILHLADESRVLQ
mmetsp:Transcript_7991/g.23828  ORF Transcript_7991/g.23828 Transcript_7991/m.23828 type:complete len:276 (+) Transcript_7991:201-1028(+)